MCDIKEFTKPVEPSEEELQAQIRRLKLMLEIKKLEEALAEKNEDHVHIPFQQWMEEAEKMIPSRYKVWCKSL